MGALIHQNILITGCSTGIGRELALQLAELGHHIFATARNMDDIRSLASTSIEPIALDVTDGVSIEGAMMQMKARGVDILINNAGYGQMGPLAELPMERLRLQFDTNVFGPMMLIQAVAGAMAERGRGRIVNVGSISGIAATPYSGAYCASKSALHLLSDALRMELAPFGISVVVLMPGGIQSSFGDNAARAIEQMLGRESLYRRAGEGLKARAAMSQSSPTTTKGFVRDIVKVITAEKAPAVYRSGHGSTLLPLMRRVLPLKLYDKILSKKFGLDKLI